MAFKGFFAAPQIWITTSERLLLFQVLNTIFLLCKLPYGCDSLNKLPVVWWLPNKNLGRVERAQHAGTHL